MALDHVRDLNDRFDAHNPRPFYGFISCVWYKVYSLKLRSLGSVLSVLALQISLDSLSLRGLPTMSFERIEGYL